MENIESTLRAKCVIAASNVNLASLGQGKRFPFKNILLEKKKFLLDNNN